MISLKLEPLEQMLKREMVLMECVKKVFSGLGFECPFDEKTIENVRVGRAQVRQLLDAGVTELAVPKVGG